MKDWFSGLNCASTGKVYDRGFADASEGLYLFLSSDIPSDPIISCPILAVVCFPLTLPMKYISLLA